MPAAGNENDLQFYPTSYDQPGVSGSGRPASFDAMRAPVYQGGSEHQGMMGQAGPAPGATSFEDEPPLLEELEINFDHIYTKTVAVLNPLKPMDSHILDDTDMAGPLLFVLVFGFVLLLSGKVHFGYIYGFGMIGCIAIWSILNMMSESGIDLYRTVSVLGYSLLPMVLLATVSVFVRLNGIVGYIAAAAVIMWCTYSAAVMFVAALRMQDQKILIAYPVGLVYAGFALLTVF